MSIQGIILDLSGTTFKQDGTIQDGIEELFSFCREHNLKTAFLTNKGVYASTLNKSRLEYDILVTPDKVNNKKKPSPKFIEYIEDNLEIPKEKFIYVGDNDFTDAVCASHAKVLYISAKWANPNPKYGIPVSTPIMIKRLIHKYFLKSEYWGWKLESEDDIGRAVQAFALLDCWSSLKDYAVSALKRGEKRYLPFFMWHLISSIYLSGIFKEIDFWSTYPSRNVGTSLNPVMSRIIDRLTKEFRKQYVDLFHRHRESTDSGLTRAGGESVDFKNQISTVKLNPDFQHAVRGKSILVLDDFITKGYSQECARNLLYQAGASRVIGMSIGKYGNRYFRVSITNNFDPLNPVDFDALDLDIVELNGEIVPSVQTVLESTFDL